MSSMQRIDQFVRNILTGKELGAHAYDHTIRVCSIAIEIGKSMGANLKVLRAAAMLHDVGRPREKETGISHSILSGQMSKDILQNEGFDDSEIEQVIDAIRTHRFSERLKPTSLEGEILSDADKLDAMGAVGIFRAIAHAAITNVGIEGFLKHAEEKLLNLRNLMYTDGARKKVDNKHEFLEAFVKKLKKETNG